MKARFRGGPLHRKVQDFSTDHQEIRFSAPYGQYHPIEVFDNPGLYNARKEGVYCRTIRPFKDGSYPFVWMGWD